MKIINQKTKIKDTLADFLFNQIKADINYQNWSINYQLPAYITDNLSRTLRDYQITAVKHFIWLFEHDRKNAVHLLFNMATGTGKTLTMAAIVLYLYDMGYRHFVFLVHQVQIKDQAVKNFTDYKFNKYLFNPKGVNINGKKIEVKAVDKFQDASQSAINFMFFSTSLLYNRLKEDKENSLISDDFMKNDTVIIADEAHRLNVDTRKKLNKTDEEEIKNWETAVISAINANSNNLLLEFTATVDLANDAIHKKYKDKLIHRYDFLQFNKDGYSKDVKFLFNQETQIEDQKRLLIINAVALSEYRRLFAEREMKVQINPIVLIKSKQVKQSEEDREFFDKVIDSLRPDDLKYLKNLTTDDLFEYNILTGMFSWLASKNGLASTGDWDGLKAFTAEIRMRFSHDNTLIYNNQKKEKAELLPLLDSPRNIIRAIFSVNALNEGWDVLSLYDIIHFDISASKKVSLQDIQLIGRGARLCPYKLPKSYVDSGLSFGNNLSFDPYKRKFDNSPSERGRILETFVYHFVKTGTFLENLQKDLLGEGIINEGVEKKTIQLKSEFLKSDTYQKGFILVNETEQRIRTTHDEINMTFAREIKASSYHLRTKGLSDIVQNQQIASTKYANIQITEDYFSEQIIRKALVSAENNFFRFNHIREHLIGIESIDDLIEKYLPLYQIKYAYEDGKEIESLNAKEKLQLLVGAILPEVRKAIDLNLPRVTGSKKFRPLPLQSIFPKEKNIYLTSFPVINPNTGEKTFKTPDERAKPQSEHDDPILQYDVKSARWYAYSENYGTSEEKRFVKYIAGQITALRQKYKDAEIYVIRNELDYWLFNPQDGRRFSPDYLLLINDTKNQAIYYQCLVEPKGGHLLEQDTWKEQALIHLAEQSEIIFDADKNEHYAFNFMKEVQARGYQQIKCLGLKFFNSDPRGESDFAIDFQNKLFK